ncbi:YoaK family protein [Pseudoflavonifractor phocaeensis]|uniref:YoaK family protein n=1 Tax=Pseudoflavonifractor phocaeensis TaxID=1870988 RepID=UPI00313AD6C1
MKKLTHEEAAETFLLAAALAVAGGFLDAYSYLVRGGVFANAETGNMVLLGIRLIQGEYAGALTYLVPILAFALGVWTSEAARDRFRDHPNVHWRQLTLGAETVIVAAVAFLPETLDMLANVLVAFTCAMQVESFRRVRGNAFASTMCTGNLRSGTESLFHFRRGKDKEAGESALCYYGIIVIFIAGAALGALTCGVLGRKAALVCAGILLFCFSLFSLRGERKMAGGA